MEKTSTVSLRLVKYRTTSVKPNHPLEASVSERQERIEGFDQKKYREATLMSVGAGGIMGQICRGTVRKGIQKQIICDPDTVELSNLNRQFFYPEDLYLNKAVRLGKNLVREGMMETEIVAYPCSFQEAVENGLDVSCDVALVGVDNDDTRVFASDYYRQKGTPVIFIAVDRIADHGSVFVQESKPNTPCFGCLSPDAVKYPSQETCPSAAAIDILMVVGGLALYAVDSLIMQRKRNWVYREVFLAGYGTDGSRNIVWRPNCPLCGTPK